MTYTAEILLTKGEYNLISRYLEASCEDEYQGEDNTISKTAVFPNGMEMDIKCCGCDDAPSWTEAVLFSRGYECGLSDPGDEFLGEWELDDYDGNIYRVLVCVSD